MTYFTRVLLLFCLITSALFSSAQSDTGKYRINLPRYWKPGNKAWRILDEKLPQVCDELKNKILCGDDCKPMYNVDFEMSAPEVFDYYSEKRGGNKQEIFSLYRFQCNLYVRNRKDEIVTRIILVDTNEVYKISHFINFNEFYIPPTPQRLYINKKVGGVVSLYNLNETRQNQNIETPYSYINKNKRQLQPQEKDLYSIIDQKIKALDRKD